MNIHYHNKKFKPVQSSENSETDDTTLFEYQQVGNILSASYQSKNIVQGHLIGLVDEEGVIDMRYHQINTKGELMTGICRSVPEMLLTGKIRLHESWEWTSGDFSKGTSVLEEI